MDDPTPSQKKQLHEVANGMLEIYRTLIRMRYLDASWIQEGPHNIESLLPMYHTHGLDASIIYLYSILPYIDPDKKSMVDFFQGGGFADFRDEEHVEQSRDPFYSDDDSEKMRPWMTPLSMLGNHRTVIIYDARRHCIGMFDQESCGSTDRNLREGWTVVTERENTTVTEFPGDSEEESCKEKEEEERDDGEEENSDGEEEECESEEDEEGNENIYDEMDSRPAVNVLRDIVRWYEELIETPGNGSNAGGEWDAELVKPLYVKHGWPDAEFDGEAFLIDQARAYAAMNAKYDAEVPLRELAAISGNLEHGISSLLWMRDNITAAKNEDEEWLARWVLWSQEQSNETLQSRLPKAQEVADRMCPNGQCQKPEELPLWEERQLRIVCEEEERGSEYPQEKTINQKAHESSRLDAERLFPGRLFEFDKDLENSKPKIEERIQESTHAIEELQQNTKLIEAWMAQLPHSAHQARQRAQNELRKNGMFTEGHRERIHALAQRVEKGLVV